MPHESRQAGALTKLDITPQMLEAGVSAFRDWLGDGRSSESIMPDEVFEAGLEEIVSALLPGVKVALPERT